MQRTTNKTQTHIWDRNFPQVRFSQWDGKLINEMPGFEELTTYYKITRDGLVISDRGPQAAAGVYTGRLSATSKKHLSTSLNHSRISSTGNPYGKRVMIAKLVAAAYLPPRQDGQRLQYIDGNCENCAVTNLQWV